MQNTGGKTKSKIKTVFITVIASVLFIFTLFITFGKSFGVPSWSDVYSLFGVSENLNADFSASKPVVLELPAGKLEKGSTPLENGKRELHEETGAIGYSYISLGQVYPSPGYTSEVIHLYACRVQNEGESKPDDGEFLNVEKIPLDKAVEMVLNNIIPDAKTQIAVLKTAMLLKSGKI